MKRVLLGLILLQGSWAFGSQLDNIAWNASDIAKLNKVDKVDVAIFINNAREPDGERLKPNEISAFEWIDLAGNGKCELVIETSYPAVSWVTIYWREETGEFRSQSIMGEINFKDGIKDLNGDDRKEIIVRSYLDPAGKHAADRPNLIWPQVYRLDGGKYVPASSDFKSFYDVEVFPKLDREIAGSGKLEQPADELFVAALEMQRDKIERVLGRNPTAGLDHAQQWAKSQNPELIDYAIIEFRDIGGHETNLRVAEQARKKALEHEHTAHPDG